MVRVMPEVSSSAVLIAGMPHAPIGENTSLMNGPAVGQVPAKSGQSIFASTLPRSGTECRRA